MSWKVSPLWCCDLSQQCGSRKWRRVGENNDQRRTGHQSLSCALLPALDVASLLAKQTNAHLDIFFFASDVAAGMMHRVAIPSSIRLITLLVNSHAVAFVNVFSLVCFCRHRDCTQSRPSWDEPMHVMACHCVCMLTGSRSTCALALYQINYWNTSTHMKQLLPFLTEF